MCVTHIKVVGVFTGINEMFQRGRKPRVIINVAFFILGIKELMSLRFGLPTFDIYSGIT